MSRPFHELLSVLSSVDERATEIWREVIKAVRENGGTGTMTVTFTAEQVGEKTDVSAKFKVKKPYPPTMSQAFWTDLDGNLLDEDPGQRSFKFGGPRPVRGPKDPS